MKEIENKKFSKEQGGKDFRHHIFSHCTFENGDYSGSNFTSARFFECSFHNCNLSLINLTATRLQSVTFSQCKFMGVDFWKCDKSFLSLQFKECIINTSSFADLPLKGTIFTQSIIKETHFTQAQLSHADFRGCNLQGSIFHHTDLCFAQFQEATNYSIDPSTNKLKKARFSQPEVLALLHYFDIIIE